MLQKMLYNLAMLLIEMVERLDYMNLTDDFAEKNARKNIFH